MLLGCFAGFGLILTLLLLRFTGGIGLLLGLLLVLVLLLAGFLAVTGFPGLGLGTT